MKMMSMIDHNDFPKKIKISGLPFIDHGWNNILKKYDFKESDGCPVYHLDKYWLYGIIPIVGIRMMRIDGVWQVLRNDPFSPGTDIHQQNGEDNSSPVGKWITGTTEVTVEAVEDDREPSWFW